MEKNKYIYMYGIICQIKQQTCLDSECPSLRGIVIMIIGSMTKDSFTKLDDICRQNKYEFTSTTNPNTTVKVQQSFHI